jgi:hypothetical protein
MVYSSKPPLSLLRALHGTDVIASPNMKRDEKGWCTPSEQTRQERGDGTRPEKNSHTKEKNSKGLTAQSKSPALLPV